MTERLKDTEDPVKTTTRRLCKSYEQSLDLNDTVSSQLFQNESSDSLPFHGFPSPKKVEKSGALSVSLCQ